MKPALHMINWTGWSRKHDKPFSLSDFLQTAASLGYKGVEVGGGPERLGTPESFKKQLEELGLEIAAYGAGVTAVPHPPADENFREGVEQALLYGAKHLAICGGFLGNNRRNTYPEDYDVFAENLGKAIAYAAENGLSCSFHPHRGCIVETIAETQMVVDRLPDLKICCDTAHLASCKENALMFIQTFGNRIVHTHIKDFDQQTEEFMEVGQGNSPLDVAACIQALKDAGYSKWLCVELDGAFDKPPAESSAISFKAIAPFVS